MATGAPTTARKEGVAGLINGDGRDGWMDDDASRKQTGSGVRVGEEGGRVTPVQFLVSVGLSLFWACRCFWHDNGQDQIEARYSLQFVFWKTGLGGRTSATGKWMDSWEVEKLPSCPL
ncbi:hypothetical protein PG990_000917 [Apiospora arundinis]